MGFLDMLLMLGPTIDDGHDSLQIIAVYYAHRTIRNQKNCKSQDGMFLYNSCDDCPAE